MSTLHVLLHGYRNAMLHLKCFAGINPISQSEHSMHFCPATSCDLLPLHIFTLISFLLPSPILSQQPLDRSYLVRHRLRLIGPTRPILPVSYLSSILDLLIPRLPDQAATKQKPSKGKASSPRPHPDIRLHSHHPLLMQHRMCLADETHHFIPGPFYGGDKTTLVNSVGVKYRRNS